MSAEHVLGNKDVIANNKKGIVEYKRRNIPEREVLDTNMPYGLLRVTVVRQENQSLHTNIRDIVLPKNKMAFVKDGGEIEVLDRSVFETFEGFHDLVAFENIAGVYFDPQSGDLNTIFNRTFSVPGAVLNQHDPHVSSRLVNQSSSPVAELKVDVFFASDADKLEQALQTSGFE